MYWIPPNWVPGYVEFLLAFPRAPRGSLSIQIWGIACATIIQLVGAATVAVFLLVRKMMYETTEKQEIKVEAHGRRQEAKKEL